MKSFKDVLKDTKCFPNYCKSIEIKESPGKGRGIFATADIPKNQTIIIENSLATYNSPKEDTNFVEEYKFTAGADSQNIGMGMCSIVNTCLQKQMLGEIQALRLSYLHAGSNEDDVKKMPSLEMWLNNKLDKNYKRP